MQDFLTFLTVLFFFPSFFYIFSKIFHFFGLRKLSLYFLAVSKAESFGKGIEEISSYCSNFFPDKKCDKCIYWTCPGKEKK